MRTSDHSILLEQLGRACAMGWHQIGGNLISPASTISVTALCGTLAMAILLVIPRGRRRRVKLVVLLRVLLPRRMIASASGRADIGWMLFGVLLSGVAIGWALLSSQHVTAIASGWLAATFGPPGAAILPGWAASFLLTVALFLAYEFAYWLDHWLSHKVPLLWEFHKVHHSAESLSLLTNFRVHPVDTIIFYNLVALVTGVVAAIVSHALGGSVDMLAIGGSNLLVHLSSVLFTHLQHSHIWVGFGPRWGRIILGPAHHQIHHSTDQRHYDRNFGASLALWDRLFGTFHRPAAQRDVHRFGAERMGHDPHGAVAPMLMPFVDAAGLICRTAARLLSVPVGSQRPAVVPKP